MSSDGLIINEKQSNLLLSIARQSGNRSLSYLAKNGGYNTFVQAFRVVNRFEDAGLVKISKEGRNKIIKLTDLGRELCRLLSEIKFLLK